MISVGQRGGQPRTASSSYFQAELGFIAIWGLAYTENNRNVEPEPLTAWLVGVVDAR